MSPALRRRVGVVGIVAAVVVGATVLGLNLIAPSHHASRSSQIAAVSPSTDGLIAPPPHVAPLRALLASKGDAVASRARTRRIPRSSLRSSSHRAAHQSGHVTYVARVTPAQSYRPAPTQYVGTTTSTDTSPTAGQSATTARQTSSAAAGPTGLGSQVGTDCNPKCR